MFTNQATQTNKEKLLINIALFKKPNQTNWHQNTSLQETQNFLTEPLFLLTHTISSYAL